MVIDDPYEIDDDSMQTRSYIEFKLEKIDEDNLRDIEKSYSIGKIDSSNKRVMLEYLVKLYKKISDIKKMEHAHEGDDNENINEYLERIISLKKNIEKIR